MPSVYRHIKVGYGTVAVNRTTLDKQFTDIKYVMNYTFLRNTHSVQQKTNFLTYFTNHNILYTTYASYSNSCCFCWIPTHNIPQTNLGLDRTILCCQQFQIVFRYRFLIVVLNSGMIFLNTIRYFNREYKMYISIYLYYISTLSHYIISLPIHWRRIIKWLREAGMTFKS